MRVGLTVIASVIWLTVVGMPPFSQGGEPAEEPKRRPESQGPSDASGATVKPIQVKIVDPKGLRVSWSQEANGVYRSSFLSTPAWGAFQPGTHELKLSAIPGRANVSLYPTLIIRRPEGPALRFVSRRSVPLHFTEGDFEAVFSGSLVIKVYYLPDPKLQELASAGAEIPVTVRLDTGIDPVKEAERRGTILAVVLLGDRNKERVPDGASSKGTDSSGRGETRTEEMETPGNRLSPGLQVTVLVSHVSPIEEVSETAK